MKNNENVITILDENEVAWQLENGLWYSKRLMQCAICPKCGCVRQIRHTWSAEYIICKRCMVHWEIGSSLIDRREATFTKKHIIDTLELLSKTEDVSGIYQAYHLPKEVEIMLMELRETMDPKPIKEDCMSIYRFDHYMSW